MSAVMRWAVLLNATLPELTVMLAAETARPAVTSAADTLTVLPLCTIGRTSVPASGVLAPVSWEIFLSAMMYS
jgi:hypothetical protein